MATIGKISPHARRLRREATDAEQRLWYHLRNRGLAGFKLRRQETLGPYVADFACPECKLVVEADGGQHGGADALRTAHLEAAGWQVLRFWNNEILTQTDAVLETIARVCAERRKKKRSPNPLPLAGEG